MRKLLFFLLLITATVTGIAQIKKAPNKQISKTQIFKRPVSKTSIHKKTILKPQGIITALNGQWRGFFGSNGDIVVSATASTEYVLELDIKGTTISGYSYSYFQDRAYFVICSLTGTFDKKTKTITVTETDKIKASTPPGWIDCLQKHTLTYQKIGGLEELIGKWRPAPNQIGDCGFGNTTLTRRTLSRNLASYNKPNGTTPFASIKPTVKTPVLIEHSKSKPPLVKNTPKPLAPAITVIPPSVPIIKETPVVVEPVPEKQPDIPIASDNNYEKRNTNLLQTITVYNPTIRVDLYDNGVVDGDSVSLFYNNRLVLSHQRLDVKAIEINLNVNTNRQVNDLTMYAENLGEIPPNTALMVVTDGDKRYEIPVTSDLKNSGTIRFVFSGGK